MKTIDVVVNCGYVLMLAGFFLRDVMWLRAGVSCGQAFVATSGLMAGRPWVLFWNGLFAAINIIWAARIYLERRPVRIPHDLQDLYERVFTALSPKEFLAFWAGGVVKSWAGETVIREGDSPSHVFLVLEGSARVEREGRQLSSLARGRFFAEMSFLTGQTASADIRADGSLRTIAWEQQALRALKASKPALFMKLQGILGTDLAAKLREANARTGID